MRHHNVLRKNHTQLYVVMSVECRVTVAGHRDNSDALPGMVRFVESRPIGQVCMALPPPYEIQGDLVSQILDAEVHGSAGDKTTLRCNKESQDERGDEQLF
ncbi:MAG: hypothetical protein JWO59_1542 [Chloroflexi bacterium]|nr:hypothetical protein [Chloroflexota bacterium]